MNRPGRVCPTHYRYGATAISLMPACEAATLYVVGGLYGNVQALDEIEAMAAAERAPATLCFNGDFNWFNVDDEGFRTVNARVLRHHALLGNVEAELQPEGSEAGCGCAYPDSVDDALVERSNLIHARLKQTAARHPDLLAALGELAMFARYDVGRLRVGVVHGDAESLAGWRFDARALDAPGGLDWLGEACTQARVDVFASSHTCLPVLRHTHRASGACVVINNGAAGMPNFSDFSQGVVTRISTRRSPHPVLYGVCVAGVNVDALAVRYDQAAWHEAFLSNWPKGSAAWTSYYRRIVGGTSWETSRAASPLDHSG